MKFIEEEGGREVNLRGEGRMMNNKEWDGWNMIVTEFRMFTKSFP